MGLSDRFTRAEWAVLLVSLGLQTVNTTFGYYIIEMAGVPEGMVLPLVLVAGGVFVLPILGVVLLSRPAEGWVPAKTESEFRYPVSEFDDDD
jgi:hypothetical protein